MYQQSPNQTALRRCVETNGLPLNTSQETAVDLLQANMLGQKQCLANAAARRCVRAPVAVRQPARSRRQLLLVRTEVTRVPSLDTLPKLEQGYTYVDVRTPEEYAAGHPPGSINIPFMLRTPEGMQPNPEFLTAWQEAFPDLGEPVIVANYNNLVDTSDGFDGWVASKLPVETSADESE